MILKLLNEVTVVVIFILRLYSIYSRSRLVLLLFICLLLAEIGVKIVIHFLPAVLIAFGSPAPFG